VTVLGVSVDSVAESKAFAQDYAIAFPLLSDQDTSVSRAYVGIDGADVTVPGIVVIRHDGQIVFRQIATSKDDRLTAAEVLDTVDRTLGTGAGAPRAATGYAVIERLQLRVEAGGGSVRTDDRWRGTGTASLAALRPLGRYVLAGPWLRTEPRTAPIDLDVALALRAPIIADAGAIQLTVTAGWTPFGATGWNGTAQIGAWVAMSPWWALHLDVGVGAHRLGDGADPAAFITFGASRLIRLD
jgi:hypothetical protein